MVKPFRRGQTFQAMIGYVTKDTGQPHYQIRLHNVTAEEVSNGRQVHNSLITSYDSTKKIITGRNLLAETFRFSQRCLAPIIAPPEYVLLYMMQSAQYILAPEFVASFKKISHSETLSLWKIIHEPESATIDMVMTIVFDSRSYGRRVSIVPYLDFRLFDVVFGLSTSNPADFSIATFDFRLPIFETRLDF